MKTFLHVSALFCLLFVFIPNVKAAATGELIKCPDFTSVYYLAENQKRYVFPNEQIFHSWYTDFSSVKDVSCTELASYQIGGNVTYQAGSRLIKIPSVPTVYVVEYGGALTALGSEAQAVALYGDQWATRVDDLQEGFFGSYKVGRALTDGEVPQGAVLNQGGALYRVNEGGEIVEVTDLFDDRQRATIGSSALPVNARGALTGLDVALFRARTSRVAEVRDRLLERLKTVSLVPIDRGQDGKTVARPMGTPSDQLSSMTSSITKTHLLSFHACDSAVLDCSNPSNHKVYLAESDHGDSWSLVEGFTPFSGSVPDVIRRGDTIYVYATTGVKRFNTQTSTWGTVQPVHVKTAAGTEQLFVDPSLIVDNGKLVMFFLPGQLGVDPARCSTTDAVSSCKKSFLSATEVDGSDGTEFVVDAGTRLELTVTDTSSASDPDIFADESGFVLYISRGTNLEAYRSSALRGTYAAISATPLVQGYGGVATGRALMRSHEYWTFLQHTNTQGRTEIRGAEHGALTTPVSEGRFEVVITAESLGLPSTTSLGSPGLALNE